MCVFKHMNAFRDILPFTPFGTLCSHFAEMVFSNFLPQSASFEAQLIVWEFLFMVSQTVYHPEEALTPLHARRVVSSPL